jgi:hypothetical protein
MFDQQYLTDELIKSVVILRLKSIEKSSQTSYKMVFCRFSSFFFYLKKYQRMKLRIQRGDKAIQLADL